MAGELVLIVDDEPNIIQLARLYLERDGYHVEGRGDGQAALQAIKKLHPALVVLDLMLPVIDGLVVCRQLRSDRDTPPILMLTARDEDIDKILGLEMGADDYMTKPFNPRELVARVKAMLRRGEFNRTSQGEAFNVGDLVIDPARREVFINGETVALRHQEFNLLLVFVEHKGLVLSREQLLSLAWGFDYPGQTRTVDVHVGQLRKKLARSTIRIETITSDGYKLVV